MIKSIIFDWHGVLDKTKFESLVEYLAELSNKRANEVNDILRESKKEYTSGQKSPNSFWLYIKQQLKLNDRTLLKAKNFSNSIKLDKDLWNFLTVLYKEYTLAILSDCPADKAAVIRKRVDLSQFEKVFFSAEIRKVKDDNTFFLDSSKILKITPSESLYVDDTMKHIDRAIKLGYQIYHYKTFNKFKEYITQSSNEKVIFPIIFKH